MIALAHYAAAKEFRMFATVCDRLRLFATVCDSRRPSATVGDNAYFKCEYGLSK